MIWRRKGVAMEYEAPVIEEVGSASDLVQTYCGPALDGGGYEFSLGCLASSLEDC